MYVDDLLFYARHAIPQHAMSLLKETIAFLTSRLRGLGLSISLPKCQLCLFTRARFDLLCLALSLEGVEIPCQSALKYFRVLWDSPLSWTPHIKYIAGKALRAVIVVRVLSRVSWGVSPNLLLTVYHGLVRAYLEWDPFLFQSADVTALHILDVS